MSAVEFLNKYINLQVSTRNVQSGKLLLYFDSGIVCAEYE